jgi:hypothetical protein
MKHRLTWEAEDGYVGGSRPQHLTVRTDDFDESQTLAEIKSQLEADIQQDFEQKVSWSCRNIDSVAEAVFAELQAERTAEETIEP